MIRESTSGRAGAVALAALLGAAGAAGVAGLVASREARADGLPRGLERYDSRSAAAAEAAATEGGPAAVSASAKAAAARNGGLEFFVGIPSGWLASTWSGTRTRFTPPDAEGPHAATTYFEVNIILKDEPLPERYLLEPGGLAKWVEEALPRYEVEDPRRVKVGPGAAPCEALLVKDPARKVAVDRRELIVLVPIDAGAYLIRFSAPLSEFSSHDKLWKSILETFAPM